MLVYLLKRLGLLLPTVLVPVLLVFFMLQVAPGDPAAILLGDTATPQQIAALRAEMGLDRPLPVQFAAFLQQLVTLDLGESISYGAPVLRVVAEHGLITLQLTLLALLIAVVVGTTAGMLAALYRNRLADRLLMTGAVTGVAIPEFWLALLLILGFAVTVRWFPVAGYVPGSEGILASLRSLTLPAVTLGVIQAAFIARMTRSSMVDVLGEPFMTTARAKGLRERTVVTKHALRAALIPVITTIGVTAAVLMGGAIAVENVFALPGLGRLLVMATTQRDYPLIQGIVLIVALAYVVINLVTDLLYALVDSRVRYQ